MEPAGDDATRAYYDEFSKIYERHRRPNDATGYHALDCLEAGRGHANVRRWLDGETVASAGDRECGKNDPEQL